jgi:hypothetical protein
MQSPCSEDNDDDVSGVTGQFQFNEEYVFFETSLITVNARR